MLKCSVICVALLLGVSATAQESTPTVTQDVPEVTGIRTEVLTIPDPSPVRSGEPMMAILYTPEDGPNIYGPAVVIVHGGLAGHPARQVGAPRFAAERLATQGYTVLSPMTRHSRDEFRTLFEDIVIDIDASLDMLEARGFQDFVLAGHSMGSIRITYYQAETQDARVKALVHFAPTSDMVGTGGAAEGLSPNYADKVETAQSAMAADMGRYSIAPDRNPDTALIAEPVIDLIGGYLYEPRSFLSHWGPTAKTRNSDWMPKNTVPILMMAGSYDSAVPPGRMDALKAVAVNSPRVDHITYEGVNHFFEGVWDQSTNDMIAWLTELELGPKPRVMTELVETRMANGRHLPGVLYLPADGVDPDKPAFILKHGWTGDILHSSNHWLGWRLAQAGYAALAPQTRTSGPRGIQSASLNDVAADLGKWVDFMEARGFASVIAEGHSAGGIWWSNYMSLNDDPRVIGMVYLAPTRDMPDRIRRGMGDDRYEAVVAQAQAAVSRGEGRRHLINEKYRPPDLDTDKGYVTAVIMLADQFLEYWGPESRAVHTERVRDFDRPSLSIAGTKDLLMSEAFLDEFETATAGPDTVIWYEGGSHGLRESKDRVLKDIVNWTQTTFAE